MFEDEPINDHVGEYKYNIATAKGLVSFALAVNSGDVKASACLNDDIDLSFLGNEFVPIGSIDNPFRGVFHGKSHLRWCCHSLSDWKTPCIQLGLEKMDGVAALFGVVGDGAEIMNVIVKGRVKCSNGPSAGLIGMIQGEGEVSICECANEANIISDFSEAAGIVARVQSSTMSIHMRDVYNIGSISSKNGITAGICGCQNNQESTFVNVFNGGVLKGANDAHFVRGALGKYINCYSTTLNKDLDNADIKLADKSFMESGDLCLALNANRWWKNGLINEFYTVWYQKIGEDIFPCFDWKRGKVFPKYLSDRINAYMTDNLISEENMVKLLVEVSKIGYGESEVKIYLKEVRDQSIKLRTLEEYVKKKQVEELRKELIKKCRNIIFCIYLIVGIFVCSISMGDLIGTIAGFIIVYSWVGGIVALVIYEYASGLIEKDCIERCTKSPSTDLLKRILIDINNGEIPWELEVIWRRLGHGFSHWELLQNYNISAVPSSLQSIKNYVEQFSSSKGDIVLTNQN